MRITARAKANWLRSSDDRQAERPIGAEIHRVFGNPFERQFASFFIGGHFIQPVERNLSPVRIAARGQGIVGPVKHITAGRRQNKGAENRIVPDHPGRQDQGQADGENKQIPNQA